MRLSPVLVDSWALLALANRADQWHAAAKKVSQHLEERGYPLVVTEWILAEFLGSAARLPIRQSAIATNSSSFFPAMFAITAVGSVRKYGK